MAALIEICHRHEKFHRLVKQWGRKIGLVTMDLEGQMVHMLDKTGFVVGTMLPLRTFLP